MNPNLKRFLLSFSPGRRVPRLVVGALAVGGITGLIVAGFEQVTEKVLLGQMHDFPIWVQAIAPVIGLVLSAFLLRYVGGKDATTGTSDRLCGGLPRPLPSHASASPSSQADGGNRPL